MKINRSIIRISEILAILTVIVLLTIPQFLKAQTIYISVPAKAIVNILGSSNVHDWTMASSGLQGQGDFKFDEGNQLRELHSFSFAVDARSLKSDHESMDSRTYKAIKADLYPTIIYKLNTAAITLIQKNKYLVKALGDLTISGVTQPITMNVTIVINPDNTINITGSDKLKLTDYKIDVPRVMMGTMKVGNDLTINFNFNCKKKPIVL